MRKWRVIREFYLGESTRIKAINPNEDNFMLRVGTTIYESEITDRVIINGRIYNFKIGTAFTRFCVLEATFPESVTGDTVEGISCGSNFIWINPSEMTIVVPGKLFITPHRFVSESLVVAVRGVIISAENDDGYLIIDDKTFEMKNTLKTSDWVMCGYVKK